MLVGDHRQLPDGPLGPLQGGLGRSLFERLIELGCRAIYHNTACVPAFGNFPVRASTKDVSRTVASGRNVLRLRVFYGQTGTVQWPSCLDGERMDAEGASKANRDGSRSHFQHRQRPARGEHLEGMDIGVVTHTPLKSVC